jgi:predicted DCC family thiol-disulfide oxidoreductase YuxK
MEPKNHIIIYFDGDCNLCNFWVKKVFDFNPKKNIYFARLNSKFSQERLKEFTTETSNINSIIVEWQNKIFIKSEAISIVLSQLQFPFSLSAKILSFTPKKLKNFLYDIIAKNRVKIFGVSKKCDYRSIRYENRMLD